MEVLALENRNLESEFDFITSRSSGPGGQHVNKVNSKVELRFHVSTSNCLTEEEKELIGTKLKNKISTEGYLILTSQSERSQFRNKEKVIEKFFKLVEKALKKEVKRKPTKPSASAIRKRLVQKRIQAQKKQDRKFLEEQ